MSYWDEPYTPDEVTNLHTLSNHIRYLEELNKTMNEAGCPNVPMHSRNAWLGKELSELYMLRSAANAPDATILQRFVTILNEELHYAVATDVALDVAVRELSEYFALKKHMRDVGIYVHFQTVFPGEEE